MIATTIVPEERSLELAQPLRAHILLENKSQDELILRAGPGAPLGQVVLDYEELLPDGTRSMRRTTRAVQVEGDLRIGPGQHRELKLELPTEHSKQEPHVLGRYRLSGRLRPYTLLSGEEPLPYFLPLFETFVFVVDASDRATAQEPQAAFEEALKAANAATKDVDVETTGRHLFIAAVIWAASDRDAALQALVAALEPAPPALARTIGAALGRSLGEPGSYTKEEWLNWWRSSQSRPRASRGPSEATVPTGLPDDEEHERDGPVRRR